MIDNKIKVILDTDIGGDCDDAGALAILQQAVKRGRVELLALTLSTPNPYSGGCADAINRWYGNTVPIGQTTIGYYEDPNLHEQYYGKHLSKNFPNNYYGTNKKSQDALRLLRQILHLNTGDKITLVAIGSFVNLTQLLKSGADDLSELTGVELFNKAIDRVIVMGGRFSQNGESVEPECNVVVDVPSARYFFANCPVPVVVSHFEPGANVWTGEILINNQRDNPVAEAYYVHSHGNRCSWDPIAVYYAIYGTKDILVESETGRVNIDSLGVSTFDKTPSGTHRLLDVPDFDAAATEIDKAMIGAN